MLTEIKFSFSIGEEHPWAFMEWDELLQNILVHEEKNRLPMGVSVDAVDGSGARLPVIVFVLRAANMQEKLGYFSEIISVVEEWVLHGKAY